MLERPTARPPQRFYQFGPFRLDAEARLLYREGTRLDVTPKAVETLILLVEQHGRLVEKKALMERLWPDTFVEDSNLTFNISTLRKALGDDRQNGTRIIETIPRRGYRFAAPVVMPASNDTTVGISDSDADSALPLPVSSPRPVPEAGPENPREPASGPEVVAPILKPDAPRSWLYLGAGLAAAAGLLAGFLLLRPVPVPVLRGSVQITHDNRLKSESTPLTDGRRLYFVEGEQESSRLNGFPGDGEGKVVTVSVDGGEVTESPQVISYPADISPDRSALLLLTHVPNRPEPALFSSNLQTGTLRRIGAIFADEAAWSPSGQSIAYAVGWDLYLANRDGSNPRKLLTLPEARSIPGSGIQHIRWSPDGRVMRFTVNGHPGSVWGFSIFEVAASGQNLHQLFPDWKESQCLGDWTPDGSYFVFQSPCTEHTFQNVWILSERKSLRLSKPAPVQLTHGPLEYSAPLPSADGRRIFAIGTDRRGELFRWNSDLREFVPYLGGISAHWVAYSPDRRWIAYITYPEGNLWLSRADLSERRQLTFAPLQAIYGVFWSPDGKQIAFVAQKEPGALEKIYLIAAEGGEPQEMLPGDNNREGIPTWSADGQSISYGDIPAHLVSRTGKEVIHICNLSTRQVSPLPGSEGLWTARWSPDGRFIAAVTIDVTQKLKIYDVAAGTWRDLGIADVEDPVWSHDGKYIYFAHWSNNPSGVFRTRISDGKYEHVADFGNLRLMDDRWNGLADDDSPLVLRDAGVQEIYALDVDWR